MLEQSKPGEEELDACFPSVVTLALGSFWFSDRLRVIEAGATDRPGEVDVLGI